MIAMNRELRNRFKEYCTENEINTNEFDSRDLEKFETDELFTANFLLHVRDDMDRAVELVPKVLRFRKEFGVNDLSEGDLHAGLIERKILYYRNRDKEGRKLLFFKCCEYKRGELKTECKMLLAFMLNHEYMKNIDKEIVLVFDMGGVGLKNVDMEFLRFQIDCFTCHFPNMIAYLLVYEMPLVVQARKSFDIVSFTYHVVVDDPRGRYPIHEPLHLAMHDHDFSTLI